MSTAAQTGSTVLVADFATLEGCCWRYANAALANFYVPQQGHSSSLVPSVAFGVHSLHSAFGPYARMLTVTLHFLRQAFLDNKVLCHMIPLTCVLTVLFFPCTRPFPPIDVSLPYD